MFTKTFRDRLFWLVLVGVSTISAILGLLRDKSWNWWVWNADSLSPTMLVGDLFVGGTYSTWHLSNSPYIFPDILLAALAWQLTGGGAPAVVVGSALQLLVFTFALQYFVFALGIPESLKTATITSVATVYLAVVIHEPFVLVTASAHHFGSVISGIALFGLCEVAISKSRTNRKTAIWISILLLTAAGTLSDSLFVPQFVLPAVAWVLFLRRDVPKVMRTKTVASAMILGTLAGYFSFNYVIPNASRVDTSLSVRAAPGRLNDIWSDVFMKIDRAWPISACLVLINLWCLIELTMWLAKFLSRKSAAANPPPERLVLAISTVATVVSVSLTPAFEVNERYFLPQLILPIFIITAAIARKGWLNRRLIPFVSATLALASLLFTSTAKMTDESAPWQPGSEALDCVNAQLSDGKVNRIAVNYWDAKIFGVHLGADIVFAQHLSDGTEYRVVTSDRYFDPSGRYEGVIISSYAGPAHTFDAEALISRNGRPERDVTCGPWRLLLYGLTGLSLSS